MYSNELGDLDALIATLRQVPDCPVSRAAFAEEIRERVLWLMPRVRAEAFLELREKYGRELAAEKLGVSYAAMQKPLALAREMRKSREVS